MSNAGTLQAFLMILSSAIVVFALVKIIALGFPHGVIDVLVALWLSLNVLIIEVNRMREYY
jgi:flagellar biosynthesis component FlhA